MKFSKIIKAAQYQTVIFVDVNDGLARVCYYSIKHKGQHTISKNVDELPDSLCDIENTILSHYNDKIAHDNKLIKILERFNYQAD